MKADAWMPFYVGDYLRDTMHLNTEQHGAYVLLILNYWVRGEALPDDDTYLASVARVMANAWQSHRQTLATFFEQKDGKWYHKRIEAELAKANAISLSRSAAGKKGANGKWHGKRMANAEQTGWQNDAPSQSQSPNKEKTNTGLRFPSLDEVKTYAEFVGVKPEEAARFWHHFEASGWIDKNGNPVRNWQSKLQVWKADNQAKALEKAHKEGGVSGSVSTILHGEEYKRVLARIKQVIDFAATDAMGAKYYTEVEKQELAALRKRRDELKAKLGIAL